MDDADQAGPLMAAGDETPVEENFSEQIDREARQRLMEVEEDPRIREDRNERQAAPGCCKCCQCLYVSLYCQLWSKADKLLVSMCIMVALMSGVVTCLFLFDHNANHGKCVLAATYRKKVPVEYTGENIWCATSMYFHVISIGLAIGLVFVNWIAQLNNNLCWQKLQSLVALLGCGGAILSGITLLYGYVRWCDQLVKSMECSYDEKGPQCQKKWCLSAARAYDQSPMKAEEKMGHVFFFALGESLAVWSAALLWLILTGAAVRKLMDGIRHEHRKQREAQNLFYSGGYQNSAPGDPQA